MKLRLFLAFLLSPLFPYCQQHILHDNVVAFNLYQSGEPVKCGDNSYHVYATFSASPKSNSTKRTKKIRDDFQCNNNSYQYSFGGEIPSDFVITIVHAHDSMQIFDSPFIDRVDFQTGKYCLQSPSASLYKVQKLNQAHVKNMEEGLIELNKKKISPHISFLSRGVIPSGVYSDITIEKSPDDNGYIAHTTYLGNELIWTYRENGVWSKPLKIPTSKFKQFTANIPGQFTIADLKFEPHINKVNKSYWSKEPLLSFYIESQMHFVNQTTAYMLLNGQVFKTSDGGNTWRQIMKNDHQITKLYFNNDEVYGDFSVNEFVKITPDENSDRNGKFTFVEFPALIHSIQFRHDSNAYFLVALKDKIGLSLFKSEDKGVTREPVLDYLPENTKLFVNNNSIILWFGEKSFWKSDDDGQTWTSFDNLDMPAVNADFSMPKEFNIANIFSDTDGTLTAVMIKNDSSLEYGNILLNSELSPAEKQTWEKTLSLEHSKTKAMNDSIAYCNCLTYASKLENREMIENGTYYRTQVKFLIDKSPVITLKDGLFWYNPRHYYKEVNSPGEAIPVTSGTYVASETTITFTSQDKRNYLNGKFYYFYDGHNFLVYRCQPGKDFGDILDFYSFGDDPNYYPPVPDQSVDKSFDHASNHIYSFTPDSEKFIITLIDSKGAPVDDAIIQYDDIYAASMIDNGKYYFDYRTLYEFQPNSPRLLVISQPEFEPLVIKFSTRVKQYVMKRKNKK